MNIFKKSIIILFLFFILLFFNECKPPNTKDFLGKYNIELKGIEVKDTTKGTVAFQYFLIQPDNSFKIFDDESDVKMSGTWKLVNYQTTKNNLGKNVIEFIIEFTSNNHKTKGTYRENRLTFNYPNDIYKGRYKSVWYIKLREKN